MFPFPSAVGTLATMMSGSIELNGLMRATTAPDVVFNLNSVPPAPGMWISAVDNFDCRLRFLCNFLSVDVRRCRLATSILVSA